MEKKIILGSMLLLLAFIFLLTNPNFTGMITSDGSYKSPTSDNSYESPTTGPGYVAPKIDESWEAPTTGPGFQKPEIGPGFERPTIGEGLQKPGTYNVSFNESEFIKIILDVPNISEEKKNETIKNDPKKPKAEPKGPIDEASVGGWKVYGITHYYKNGGSKFLPATIAQMNLHNDGTYDYRGHEGTWEAAAITEEDWEKWGIRNENFKKKLVFHNWPDGADGTAEGPIEDTSYGARYLWAVFNAEPPESAEPAQAWVRFVAAPYNPKAEDEAFSELSLIGRWGIHFTGITVNQGEQGGANIRYERDPLGAETTTILEIKADKTWAFGTSKGTWKVLPIEEEDWKKWEVQPYGPKKKIVLNKFGNDGGSGPIEAYKGEVSFFWVMYQATNPETGAVAPFQKKFRPYESPVTYLTAEVKGAGKISTADNKLSCAIEEKQAAQAHRGRFFRRSSWSADTTGAATNNQAGCAADYEVGKEAELTAIPENGWLFLKWGGACEGNENTCKVTMDRSKSAIAEFVPGCIDDSACSSDQKCENSKCTPVECECGYAANHQCLKYECCSKADCGEEKSCDTTAHKCVSESACREFSIKGSSEEKHDIVFVGDGFNDYKMFRQLLVFLVDYDEKYNGMFSVTPFRENKDKFNFWMVLAPDYRYEANGEPINEDIERFVKTCERDTVVVISRNTYRPYAFFPTAGSKGGVAYVSIGFVGIRGIDYASENSGRLMLHELGHAIGGLADEYVEYGKGTRDDLYRTVNCAEDLESAKAKWGELVGVEGVDFYTGIPDVPGTKYFKNNYVTVPEIGLFPDGSDMGDGGCSYDLKNIRPTTSSIMKNQFEIGYDYGPVNEKELAKKLDEYQSEPAKENINTVASQGGRGRRFVEDAG